MRSLSLFYVEFIQRKKDARKTLLKGSASTRAIEKDAIEEMRVISLFSLSLLSYREKKNQTREESVPLSLSLFCALIFDARERVFFLFFFETF